MVSVFKEPSGRYRPSVVYRSNRLPNVSGAGALFSAVRRRSWNSCSASRSARSLSWCPRLVRRSPSPGSHTDTYSGPSGLRSYTRTRAPRRGPHDLDQQLGLAITALLASEEAAGELVYTRTGRMRRARLTRKVPLAKAEPPAALWWAQDPHLALFHEACEMGRRITGRGRRLRER